MWPPSPPRPKSRSARSKTSRRWPDRPTVYRRAHLEASKAREIELAEFALEPGRLPFPHGIDGLDRLALLGTDRHQRRQRLGAFDGRDDVPHRDSLRRAGQAIAAARSGDRP